MKFIYTITLVCLYHCSFGQKMPDYGLHKIRITDTDRTILAEIIPVNAPPETRNNLTYYWYAANRIHTLQGGFSGQLLNGKYTEAFLNTNLRMEGTFKKGLKDGIWKDWNERGVLLQVVKWKNGIRSGLFSFYKPDGSLKQTGEYHEDRLDGAVILYEGPDSARTTYYDHGRALEGKPKSLLNRINIFRKKTKPVKPHA
jgi:antitoxin component YwqK of YwqJK toxin-antitoxin module